MMMMKNKNGNKVLYQYEGTFGGVRVDSMGKFYAGFGTDDIREVPRTIKGEEKYINQNYCMTREQFNKLDRVYDD